MQAALFTNYTMLRLGLGLGNRQTVTRLKGGSQAIHLSAPVQSVQY